MEQQQLFNLTDFDNQNTEEKVKKTKLGYGALLLRTPDIPQDIKYGDFDLFTVSILYRKAVGNLLIELHEKKLEATDFLTRDVFKEDREFMCAVADLTPRHLETWTKQIINGAICFDSRILDDSLKAMLGFSKKRPEMDLSVIEDWSKEEFEETYEQLELNL